MAKSTILGYPRIGLNRELKFATEKYWREEISLSDLEKTGKEIRKFNLNAQQSENIDLPTSNDFSFYDQMLDMSTMVGVIPSRYGWAGGKADIDTYFAMARGSQKSGTDVMASEMTKWFNTNYHYIVPEFEENQKFKLSSNKVIDEYLEAKNNGIETRPVLIGIVSYLLLGKNYSDEDNLKHLDSLLEIYIEIINKLEKEGASWVQFDEPCLVTDLDHKAKDAYITAYKKIKSHTKIKIFITTSFGKLDDNLKLVSSLPIDAIHIDLIDGKDQLEDVLNEIHSSIILSMGIVNGRNIWKTNLEQSLQLLERAASRIGKERIWVSSSCSLLHVPYDLECEDEINTEIKNWLSFAKQKLNEISILTRGINDGRKAISQELVENTQSIESRKSSNIIHDNSVKERINEQPLNDAGRKTPFLERRKQQQEKLKLPLFPTTTIGSFPQTKEVRQKRASFKNKKLSSDEYDNFIKQQIDECIKFQEEIDLDVLVHGEFERNDMVEFFGEKLTGFTFTKNGWVQSYGSRGVKPPIIFGDVLRQNAMTVDYTTYAQSKTSKPVKGMLTGPVTILQWSFVRDDQDNSKTAHQIALALQDEVLELEEKGISIIQIDEPAFREGVPLRKKDQEEYFNWAVQSFKLSSTGVKDETQIHTHMCYSDFNNIISAIKDLDADVISIETSRSQMELLDAFVTYKYPAEIGPGVYDIHSPRIPSEDEMIQLIEKASDHLEKWQIWINPDCGLKTRNWDEVKLSLRKMTMAAKTLRERYKEE